MRRAFVDALVKLAQTDERIFLITADLGWGALDAFVERFPTRYLNVGVAEQNMAGIATGLASVGFVPFIYSIATFVSMRCFEQIRNGPILHRLPMRIIGIGGGYDYGSAGPTHYALEDLAIFRTHPGIDVVAPADPEQTRACVFATASVDGPIYLRIAKGPSTLVPGLNGKFEFGRAELIKKGRDVLILTCGAITAEALEGANLLQARSSIAASVAVVAHLPSFAKPALIELIRDYPLLVTVEEGFISGGLFSLISEAVAYHNLSCRVLPFGVRKPLDHLTGSGDFMRASIGISAEAMAESIAAAVAERQIAT